MKFLVLFALALATTSVVPISATKGRISNGNKYPYQAGLSFFNGSHERRCGGSLIDNRWVVSSASCIMESMEKVIVYLGNITFGTSDVNYTVNSSELIVHPGYDGYLANNIILIKIPYTDFTDNISKVQLPPISSSYLTYVGMNATASCCARTNGSSPAMAATVIPNVADRMVTSSKICVNTSTDISACRGFFGGPLVLDDNITLIGVGSFYATNNKSSKLFVFSRVTSYLDWIKNNTLIYY